MREYYIVYIDEDKVECHLCIMAHTAREALNRFHCKTHNLHRVNKVIEWVSNNLQVTHGVKDNDIITT
jgi:hypothetical protein